MTKASVAADPPTPIMLNADRIGSEPTTRAFNVPTAQNASAVRPTLPRDHVDPDLQLLAGEALGRQELAHLFTLTLRHQLDVPMLANTGDLTALQIRPRPEETTGGHAQPVGDQVRHTQHHHHTR